MQIDLLVVRVICYFLLKPRFGQNKQPKWCTIAPIVSTLSALCCPLSLPLAEPDAPINSIGVYLGPGELGAALAPTLTGSR